MASDWSVDRRAAGPAWTKNLTRSWWPQAVARRVYRPRARARGGQYAETQHRTGNVVRAADASRPVDVGIALSSIRALDVGPKAYAGLRSRLPTRARISSMASQSAVRRLASAAGKTPSCSL